MNSTNTIISSFNRLLKTELTCLIKVMKDGLKQEDPKFHYVNIKISNWIVKNLDNSMISCYRTLNTTESKDFMSMKRCIQRDKGVTSTELLSQCVVIARMNFNDLDVAKLYQEFLVLRRESYEMWQRIREGVEDATIQPEIKPINNNPIIEKVINEILNQVPKNLKHNFRIQLTKVDNPLQHLQRLIKSNNLDIQLG